MERLTTKYNEENVAKEICTINRFGEADDCSSCAEICEECNSDCENCAIQKCFDKLASYEDAEEQGLLLRLPCKVGDTVYVFRRIDDILTVGEHTFKTLTNLVAIMENGEFGREVFLTREEAEQALADMGGVRCE